MLKCSLVGPLFGVFLAVSATARSQSFNGAIAGVVRDIREPSYPTPR